MKLKNKIIGLLLVFYLVAGLMPTAAFAAGTGKAIQLGTDALNESVNDKNAATVYFGKNNEDAPGAWRVIGYNGEGVASAQENMTLLAADKMGLVQFDIDRTSNEYADSDLKTAVDALAEKLTEKETAAVNKRTLVSGSYDFKETDCVSGAQVDNAVFWPLSTKEAYMVSLDIRSLAGKVTSNREYYWWLRSPGDLDYRAALVNGEGNTNEYGHAVNLMQGVRPAVNLNLDSVLFTSAAEGGKSSGPIGAGALEEVLKYTGSEWKLTLKDGSRDSFSVDETTVNGNALTVDYSGATTGTNEYISAVVMDSSNTVIYYGRIKSLTDFRDASGTVQITLPRGFIRSTDTLYLFSEQYNGDYMTDYASDLVALTIPEDSGVELRSTDTSIQWRHVGEDDSAWRDLVALSAITGGDGADGADGREVELQVANGYIQWRYITGADTAWKKLMPLSDLKGDSGEDGEDGREVELQNNGTSIQWRYVGETEWKDLVDLSAITGSDGQDGSDGTDGREVELRVEGSYIQWKYDADSDWQNLIAVSALQGIKGDKGDPGEDGDTPTIGANGNWWIGGVDTGIPATGSDGADGSDGSDGTDGLTPYIGSNGNWWIGSTDTGIKATGSDGKGGQNGVDGQDGKDGVGIANIEINENGELVVTLTDGTEKNLGKVTGSDGVGITGAAINDDGELILTLSDGTELNAGVVRTEEAVAAMAAASEQNSGQPTLLYIFMGISGLSLAGLIALLIFLYTKRKILFGK